MKPNRYDPQDCTDTSVVAQKIDSLRGDFGRPDAYVPVHANANARNGQPMAFQVLHVGCIALCGTIVIVIQERKICERSWVSVPHALQEFELVLAINVQKSLRNIEKVSVGMFDSTLGGPYDGECETDHIPGNTAMLSALDAVCICSGDA